MNKFRVQLPVSVFKEGKLFVAYSPSLDLSTSGKTYEEAMKRFNEIVEIFFEELAKKGTTEEILVGLGWEKAKRSLIPPVPISHESKQVEFALK